MNNIFYARMAFFTAMVLHEDSNESHHFFSQIWIHSGMQHGEPTLEPHDLQPI